MKILAGEGYAMRHLSICTAIICMALAVLVAGCATERALYGPGPYMPTEQTGKSTEQLRAELEGFLKQVHSFSREKPFWVKNENLLRLEMGEDYVSLEFGSAWTSAPSSVEHFRYSFLLDRLAEPAHANRCSLDAATLPDTMILWYKTPIGHQVCNVAYTLGLRAVQQRNAERARFDQLAAQPRNLPSISAIPEDLRRLIVRAEALRQEKNYPAAAAAFRKAIRQEPVAYPSAYFNLALLYEMLREYPHAIESMQRYLLLQPQAKDARSAQDKIYEWEMKTEKQAQ